MCRQNPKINVYCVYKPINRADAQRNIPMKLFHKAMVLVSIGCLVEFGISYFMGGDVDSKCVLIMALVLVSNLRELQFEHTKDLLEGSRSSGAILFEAVRREFGTEGQRRVKNRSLDILAEHAPEDIREEVLNATEAIKKLNK